MFLEDFVYVGYNAFTKEVCNNIIADFEILKKEGKGFKGLSGAGENNSIKNSYDMNVLFEPELSKKYQQVLVDTFNNHLTENYLKNLPYQDKFPIHSLFNDPTFFEILQIQKYDQNVGHFNAWHVETGNADMARRLFVFILYLNDVGEGGETEVLYARKKVKPQQGTLVIHPASFPFVHKGHMPLSGDKYILTSWLSFPRNDG
jgi:hypothetical protein